MQMNLSYITITKNGFIRMVLLIIMSLLLLSYFKIDLRNIDISGLWKSNLTHGNINFIWSSIQEIWYNYIKTPMIFLLHYILNLIQ